MPRPYTIIGRKLSELTEVSAVLSSDLILIESDGNSYSIVVDSIISSISEGVNTTTSALVDSLVNVALSALEADVSTLSSLIHNEITEVINITTAGGGTLSGILSQVPIDVNSVILWPIGGPLQGNSGLSGSDFFVTSTVLTCYTSAGFISSDNVYVQYDYYI